MIRRTCLFFTVLLAATAAFPTGAVAAQFEIAPFAGLTWGGNFTDSVTGNSIQLDDTTNYGLMVDIWQNERSQIEVLYSHQATRLRPGNAPFIGTPLFDIDIDYLHIGGTYTEAEGKVKPYVAGGIGATQMRPKGPGLSNETRFSLNLGVGVRLEATERIGMRLEGRWFGTLFNGGGSVFCSNGACALTVKGDLFSQVMANAGVYFAF
jgi:opacity protein-like surface antigen